MITIDDRFGLLVSNDQLLNKNSIEFSSVEDKLTTIYMFVYVYKYIYIYILRQDRNSKT